MAIWAMPGRFGLTYIGEDGAEHTPVMLHRAILGSLDRGQCADGRPGKVGIAGGIEEIDAGVAVMQVGDGRVQRVMIFAFERIEIADGSPTVHAAGCVERAALV